ncbi:MAG: metalloregulator ArsR/SmtB family transcription factor [Gemmatimonadales bacterium]|nr:metalloregulator ArsR/SmtB family transcription factor [Gemmatimonadales bacterium]
MPKLSSPRRHPRPTPLDRVFYALSDPTRRGVVQRLGRGACPTMTLARSSRMALPSFTQHLDVLRDAGLVRSHKQGRVRTWELVPGAMDTARHWLEIQRDLWTARLDQLDAHLLSLQESRR